MESLLSTASALHQDAINLLWNAVADVVGVVVVLQMKSRGLNGKNVCCMLVRENTLTTILIIINAG